MPEMHTSPVVQPRPTWIVCLSPSDLRLLKACVSWLQQSQRDLDIQQQLARVRQQLERARPVTAARSRQPARTRQP
jgi:hypothetical protein